MIKSIDTCHKCKYNIMRYCTTTRCKDCKMSDNDKSICKCSTINAYEECPYFEEDKEVNDKDEH